MKILTIVGARPQFIKAATVSRAIKNHPNSINKDNKEIIVHTGQHYDKNMSDVFFQEMQIPEPNYHLGIGGSSHGKMTGKMLAKIEEVILQEKPDCVLVYGDTNSTLAGALAAVKLHIPVAHVEAGLRSFNLRMPEEVNRILTDQISKWLFCPTEIAVNNLKSEGLAHRHQSSIYQVGDVMYDAILFYQKIAKPTDEIAHLLEKFANKFYLATIHRAENTNDPIKLFNVIKALEQIGSKNPVILPLHPRTARILKDYSASNITIIEPVGYFDMISLLSKCKGVFTDSGGLQKEAYFFHKPCVILRDETEWIELVNYGFNTLVGTDVEKILSAEKKIKNNKSDYSIKLYGEGQASQDIINILLS